MFKRWLFIKQDKSALIIGPRRAGKTTFLRNAFPDIPYASLDDFDFYDWAKKDPKGFVTHLGSRGIIDEIQRLPQLTRAVKHAIDSNGAVLYLTGSSSAGLLDVAADTLAGRINLYSLPTACWGEDSGECRHALFHDSIPLPEIREAMRGIDAAVRYGQFPEVLTKSDAEEKKALLKNYRDTYFIRETMRLSNIENHEGLFAIFNNLARSIGSHLEVSHFAREAGLSFPTARKYLGCLQQSQLTFKLYGYQYGPAKRHIKSAKTYFADNGIIGSLNVSLNDGQLFENFVIAELEKRRRLGLIPADQFYYYKSAAGREIDLVFDTGEMLYAVEIKSTRTPADRDISALRAFARQSGRPVKLFLIYAGEEYGVCDTVRLIPAGALFRGGGDIIRRTFCSVSDG